MKLSNENRLSAYGAERNIPAGEIIWKVPVRKENLSGLSAGMVGRTVLESSYKTSTDNRWQT